MVSGIGFEGGGPCASSHLSEPKGGCGGLCHLPGSRLLSRAHRCAVCTLRQHGQDGHMSVHVALEPPFVHQSRVAALSEAIVTAKKAGDLPFFVQATGELCTVAHTMFR